MADLTVQEVDRDGLNPTYASAAGGGDAFVNDGKTWLHIKNGDVSSKTVTIATAKTVDGLAVADRDVTIPASEERLIGPFPPTTYNDGDGKVQLTYDAVTSVTVAVKKLAVT